MFAAQSHCHSFKDINFFIFAKGLKKVKETYLYDSIIYAEVKTCHDETCESQLLLSGELIEDEENLMASIENIFTPPRSFSTLKFGVLGYQQFHFFTSIWPKNLILDVLHPLLPKVEPEKIININKFGWNEKHLVLFAARRIEMFQDLLHDFEILSKGISTDYESIMFNDLVIPEKRRNGMRISLYNEIIGLSLDAILKIDLILHAYEVMTFSNEIENTSHKNVAYQSLILAPIREKKEQNCYQQFSNQKDLSKYLKRQYHSQNLNIAVLGVDEYKFFKSVFEIDIENGNKKIMDVSFCIPKDIDYICKNIKHAKYHARRIQFFQAFFKFYNHLPRFTSSI